MDLPRQSLVTRALALALFAAPCLHAQEAPKPAPWGLFTARFDTHTSNFIYALYGLGHNFGMVAVLENPRSGWHEVVGAVGRTIPVAGSSHAVAAGVAHAEDGWYGQVYYVPASRVGPVWLRATAELDVPLSAEATTQFALSPISVTLPVTNVLEAGVSMDLGTARGARSSVAIGPELRVAIPGAVIGTDLQRMTDGSLSRLRMFFTTQF